MKTLKARIMVIAAAALVGAVAVPAAVASKGADDPAGHARHAKLHDNSTRKQHGKKGTRARTGQVRNSGATAKGREAEPNDDRGQQAEPGDDRGQAAEPGDDRGQDAQAQPADDRGQDVQTEPADDRGGHGNDDSSGHH